MNRTPFRLLPALSAAPSSARSSALPAAILAAGSAFALSACASTGDYPSLARRDAERITGSAPVVAPEPPPAPPPAPPSSGLEGRLAGLVDQAGAAHQRFAARRGRTEQLIGQARGAAVASESWSVASIALAELESARADAMIALAELDSLFAAESVADYATPSTDPATIGGARDKVAAWIAEEDEVLSRLRGRLAS